MSAALKISPPCAEDFEDLPAPMRGARRWLLHRDKRPHYVDGSPRSKTDTPEDAARLATFEDAVAQLASGAYDGLGFALGPDGSGNYWQGIDLDDIHQDASLQALAEDLPGYVEISPSGRGLHAIGYGRRFNALGSNGTGIEAYSEGRYFTVTGQAQTAAAPVCVADHVETVLAPLHKRHAAPPRPITADVYIEPDVVRDLRSALTALNADDRELWVAVGHALKPHGDVGRSLWLEWSQTSEKYEPTDAMRVWGSLAGDRTGYAAIFAKAKAAGWLNPRAAVATSVEAQAASAEPGRPLPLFPPMPRGEAYPIHALGPVLAPAARAIASKVQVPGATAAQSVLGAAALAAQAHANVRLPFGQTRPLSLFLMTVAGSGDRKSSADNEALWPIRKREKALREIYDQELPAWTNRAYAYQGERKKIEGNKKLTYEGKVHELNLLGPEPERPLFPFLVAQEPTIEGLTKAMHTAPAALGIFSAEGGQFVNGHGMTPENRLRTAAAYSELWDGQPIKRVRSLDGVSILVGRRLSMHLMVQPDAATVFLSDPVLRDQGLLSRVLVAAPESIAGTRMYRETSSADDAAIAAYGARLLSLLEAPWPLADGKRNELEPRALDMTSEAVTIWQDFYDRVELQCRPGGPLKPLQDFASKAAEHAARIAGVLTIVGDHRAVEITADEMRFAVELLDWYLDEAVRLNGAARMDPDLLRAQSLLDWLRENASPEIGFRDTLTYGPNALRTKSALEKAVATLIAHGWLEEVQKRPRTLRLLSEEAA